MGSLLDDFLSGKPGGSGLCSLTSCWFLTKGTSLNLILLSLILVQIRSCINSYRGVLFILPEPSLCARPNCQCVWNMEGYFFLHPLGRRKLVKNQWKSQSTELCLRTRNQSNKWTCLRRAGAPGKHRLSVQNHYWLLHSGLVLITGK